MQNEVVKRVTKVYSLISPLFFGRYLNRGEITEVNKDSIRFSYILPDSICKEKQLTCSGAFAIADELSTVGLLVLDKSHRPGVSITLSMKLENNVKHPVLQGERLSVDVQYDKIGKSVAFMSMTIRDSHDTIVARGNHIKYLPISWLYDNILCSSFVFPWLTSAVYNLNHMSPTWLGQYILDSFGKQPREDEIPSQTNVYQQIHKSLPLFPVKRMNCNPFSMLHGGCAAMLIEEAACKKLGLDRVNSIVVNYMNGIASGKTAEVDFDEAKSGYVTSNGKVMASFTFE